MAGNGDEYLRSFYTGAPVAGRRDLLGVAHAPVDALWYDTIDATGFNPGGLFAVTAPRDACFDKISLREGWQPSDFYLLFDGISGGSHSFQDANCIVRFAEGGVFWMSDTYDTSRSATVRAQNGVFVALDGAGPGRLHRYARRLYAAEAGGYHAAAAALEGVGDVDWQRHIVRKRGRWTLVVDRAVVKKAGEVLSERHWHIRGNVSPRPDGLTSVQSKDGKQRCLHLQSAGLAPDGMSGSSDRVEIVRASAAPDHPLEFATLLYTNESPDEAPLRLTQTTAGWRVDSPEGAEFVLPGPDQVAVVAAGGGVRLGAGASGETQHAARNTQHPSHGECLQAPPLPAGNTLPLRPQGAPITLPWRPVRVGERPVTAVAIRQSTSSGRSPTEPAVEQGRAAIAPAMAAGDAGGNVALFAADGAQVGAAKVPSAILSLHFFGEDLLVGEERGALTRLAPDGKQRWQVEIPYVPMAWPYWSEQKSRIREITSADLSPRPDAPAQPTILVANSDRRVYAFSGEGKELWKTSVEWGVYTAMTAGTFQGKPALFGGTSNPSIHGRCLVLGGDGQRSAYLARPDLVSWSLPAQFRDMRLADLDGDGAAEVINAVDTNCRQLVVYRGDGTVLWDADVAGAAEAVAVAAGMPGGASRVLCAAASGYVCAFDGKSGKRLWACFIGEPARLVAPLPDGRTLAAAPSGHLFLMDGEGALVGGTDLGEPITAVLRPGDHRTDNRVLLGTAGGRVYLLPAGRGIPEPSRK